MTRPVVTIDLEEYEELRKLKVPKARFKTLLQELEGEWKLVVKFDNNITILGTIDRVHLEAFKSGKLSIIIEERK